MTTFIFIVVVLFLIFLINTSIRSGEPENLKSINKKSQIVANIGLVFLVAGILFINFSGYFQTDKEIELIEEKRVEDSIQKSIDSIVNIPTAPLTAQEQFLADNGFKKDAVFTESQFNEFKSIIETGLFKDESFCDVFQKSLDITNNSKTPEADLKKLYSKYKKIPYIDTVISIYGFQFCTPKPISSKEDSSSYINSDDSANPCVISEDFIKQDLQNPETADFSMFDCSADKNSDGTYTILRKVSAKNSYGVEKEFIYKVKLGFKGGNWVDMSNWNLISIQSEEYK